jgi:hypothetical protein
MNIAANQQGKQTLTQVANHTVAKHFFAKETAPNPGITNAHHTRL